MTDGIVEEVLAALPTDGARVDRQHVERALGQLEREIECYAEAIAKSGPLDSLLAARSPSVSLRGPLWSLHGLHECLTRRGETVEAALIKQRLDLALARSEVPVKASCFCRMKVAA